MSNEYRHILVAVDLTKDSHRVLERAVQIAERNQAKLSIMHTLEPLGFAYGGDIPMDLTSIQDQRSEEHTSELQSRPHLVCRLLPEKKKEPFCCRSLFSSISTLLMLFSKKRSLLRGNSQYSFFCCELYS